MSRTIVSPLERLKILLQIQNAGRNEYKLSIGKGLIKMWREEGWRGFMRGNGTNCIRIIPYSAVQFGSYSFYKKVRSRCYILYHSVGAWCFLFSFFPRLLILTIKFLEPSPGGELTPLRRLLCGALAGITSVTVTYPLDIVRTRLSIQSASFADIRNSPDRRLPGMFKTMGLMYRTEGGFIALYRGIIPTVAGVAPYVSLIQ